jgi:general stress protein YciG
VSGTIEGGRKARDTNKANHGEDFYKRIGAEGGKLGHTGGFYANRELARLAGAKGGRKTLERRKSLEQGKVVKDVGDQGTSD